MNFLLGSEKVSFPQPNDENSRFEKKIPYPAKCRKKYILVDIMTWVCKCLFRSKLSEFMRPEVIESKNFYSRWPMKALNLVTEQPVQFSFMPYY